MKTLLAGRAWRNLYIHIPFCAGKCGYCAFYSETRSSLALRQRYLDSVIGFLRNSHFASAVQSIYIGGGTPNFLSAAELERLFSAIEELVPKSDHCEISCELNPELLTNSKLQLLNSFATRLSLGVQSFDENVRNKLMRKCSQENLHKALALLEKRSAVHFNIDLIYGIKGVPEHIFFDDVQKALALGVDHLSCYSLTAEENSLLGLNSPVGDDDVSADCWLALGDFLAERNMMRYEISNYAFSGGECQHNTDVWRGGTLLGVGAAAAGFDGIDRYNFKEDINAFIAGESPVYDRITAFERMLEIFAVNLRTTAGWDKAAWENLYPGTWEFFSGRCRGLAAENPENWNVTGNNISLSGNGLLFWDDAAMEIIGWEDEVQKI